MNYNIAGLQLLLDLYDCRAGALDDSENVEGILRQALEAAGFQVVNRTAHEFPHHGITLVLVLAQSHATLHTWPESNFATLDVYACGKSATIRPSLERVRDRIVQQLAPKKNSMRFVDRGLDTVTLQDVR